MALTLNTQLDLLQPSGIRRFSALAKATPGCISLTLGEPDFNTPEPVKAQVGRALDENLTHYPLNNGQPYLREAIADYQRRMRGLEYAPEEIVVTCGATEALFASLSAVLNPGDEVIVPVPSYTLYQSIIVTNRAVPVFLDTTADGFQLTREALESVASPRTKAIVFASPNNPTGCVLNEASLAVLADFAAAHDIFVICDDVYARLTYNGPIKTFAAEYPQLRDRIIVCDSFSKPFAMTGWRLGWVAADARVISHVGKIHQYMVSSVPSFVQYAATEALQQNIDSMLDMYAQRRNLVLTRMGEMGLKLVQPEGAFYAFPCIEEFGMTSEEFCTRLIQEHGVALVPGVFFGAEGYVRLSYCCALEEIAEGLNRLEAFVAKLRA